MTEKPACFVIMPFTVRESDLNKYSDANHWTEVYEGLIQPAGTLANFACLRDDSDQGSRLIVQDILRKIESAEVVLCDLSSHNPNVFLELGWAIRADKKFVLIKDDLTDYTFDLNQNYTFTYQHSLQPTVLKAKIEELSDVLKRTQGDDEKRYSYVRRLAIEKQAIEAANEGDLSTKLLIEIKSLIRDAIPGGRRSRYEGYSLVKWPLLLERAVRLLNEAYDLVKTKDLSDQGLCGLLEDLTAQHAAYRSTDLQLTIVDSEKRFYYHDWPELIGQTAFYRAAEGGDIYKDVALFPFGAVAWTDHTTNIPESLGRAGSRFSIAIFNTEPKTGYKILVEVHQEKIVT